MSVATLDPATRAVLKDRLEATLADHLTLRTGVILEEAEYAEIAEKLTKTIEVAMANDRSV